MDSIKIIKKHGQPGGLPVLTVYVDEDAPGEGQKLYQHRITRNQSGNSWAVVIVSTDATPFTGATFAKWLYDKGFISYGGGLPIQQLEVNTNNGTLQNQEALFSANGTYISVRYTSYTPSITDNTLTYTTESTTALTSVIYDTVFEIL